MEDVQRKFNIRKIDFPEDKKSPSGRHNVFRDKNQGFPGGAVVKNPPANAGDTGSSPGLGRSHMPQSNELLSLSSGARKPQLLSPRATITEAHAPRVCAPQQEKPLQ